MNETTTETITNTSTYKRRSDWLFDAFIYLQQYREGDLSAKLRGINAMVRGTYCSWREAMNFFAEYEREAVAAWRIR